ncbi:MAG: SOS response-associated peptidase [Thermomicrobiales bacterium]|nr:SOS response-associated peptidase [Thermomicrobiales bacterium]
MCGRYPLDAQALSKLLEEFPFRDESDFQPNYNAAPTQQLPVIINTDGSFEIRLMHWGLIPGWLKPGEKPKVTPFNARSETLTEKPMFRKLVRNHRCIVPASGFYEWKRTGAQKQPYYIHLADQPIMLMAGLFDFGRDDEGESQGSYTILTTTPNDVMAEVHDRMPVILHPDDVPLWMDEDITEIGPLESLLQPIAGAELEMYPVSMAVNNARNNGPELLKPVVVQEKLL